MPDKQGNITLGVIADTHVPDRVKELPEGMLEVFEKAGVDQIFHAGDASCRRVVKTLESIAPVNIVRGNRDWLFGMRTPHHISLNINGINITMAHGHRSMIHYLFDKWSYLTNGYQFERYRKHLAQDYPSSNIIIFGHTHYQTAEWVSGTLFFNPGAAYPCQHNHFNPQFGIIRITPEGKVEPELHKLY
jgi:putative phosphoesterase